MESDDEDNPSFHYLWDAEVIILRILFFFNALQTIDTNGIVDL